MKRRSRGPNRDVVSAFEAKTHLSELLRETERGHSYTIERRGKPVARLVPAPRAASKLGLREAGRIFDEIRSRIRGKVDVLELIREGRRH